MLQTLYVPRLPPQPCLTPRQRAWRSRQLAVHVNLAASAAPSTSEIFPIKTAEYGWKTGIDNHYVRGSCVGAGSFGTVFKAIDLHTGQEAAIKTMPKFRGKLSGELTMEKLMKEVDVMERLHNSYGVIRLLDCFEDEKCVHLVTEFCAGGDLQRLVDGNGTINESSLALVALESLKIIQGCHSNGILHGDVKPANFVIKHAHRNPCVMRGVPMGPGPWLRAIDFGCSQYLTGVRFAKRKGTPVYMAPEIFGRDYSTEADMWGVGVMLYQLFARRFPFWDNISVARASKLEDIATAVATAEIKYDYGPWKGMSRDGIEFISALLERNHRDRMTVDEALQHKWLKAAIVSTQPPPAYGPACGSAPGLTGAGTNNIVRAPLNLREAVVSFGQRLVT
jgi:serine/threonine protein kinase